MRVCVCVYWYEVQTFFEKGNATEERSLADDLLILCVANTFRTS